MPDIMMCEGYDCPKKNECYRFRAIPDPYWQSYVMEKPYQEGKECTYFMSIGDRRNLKEIKDDGG